MYSVHFVRVNKNVWLVVFTGLAQNQIDTLLGCLNKDFYDIEETGRITWNPSSIPGNGLTVVCLDRAHKLIPPAVKELIRNAVNAEIAGIYVEYPEKPTPTE